MINLSLSLAKSGSFSFIWLFFVLPSCVLSTDELYRRCKGSFSCSNQSDLFYPFWKTGREGCGHPDFKLECSTSSAEVSISSVKFKILEANSGFIKLARSGRMGDSCPSYSFNALFHENVLQVAPGTEMLIIYYDCNQDFSASLSNFAGKLDCEDDENDGKTNYYVTGNLSSPPPQPILYNFSEFCDRNVSIPASGPALNTLRISWSEDNLKNALNQGFQLALNRNCPTCIQSGGACGYSHDKFVCYSKNNGNMFLPTCSKIVMLFRKNHHESLPNSPFH